MHPPRSSASSRFPRSPAYSRYAEVYDRIGQRTFGECIASATLQFLSEIDEWPTKMIDLACGTGAASLAFAAAGISVVGIDQSTAMLERARCAASDAGLSVEWRAGDLREFFVDEPVDLVTCFYDGYNYLTESSELSESFASVWNALRSGGLFIFDLNTRAKFGASWNDLCLVAVDRDDLFGLYQSWFQPETGLSPLILTFFVRTADGAWDRFDEEHVERAYPLAEVRSLLSEAGFHVESMLDYIDRSVRFGGAGSEQSHRVVFIARRDAGMAESLP
jgi:SAM-dependent methyltransferase